MTQGRYSRDITTLAAFAADLRLQDVPSEVLERGRAIMIDCIRLHRRRAARRGNEGAGRARSGAPYRGGDGARPQYGLAAEAAAFLNGIAGTLSSISTKGNLHTKGHSGIQILPAAFAEAETAGNSGADLLLALIAAYEVGCRIFGATGGTARSPRMARSVRMAAAIAVAKLRRWQAEHTATVIADAATLGIAASRTTLTDGATVRNAYTGMSGRLAFVALDLAGIRDSPASATRSAPVFGKIYGEAYSPDQAIEGLGHDWQILRNYFKLYPCGRYVHSAIDLIDLLQAQHGPLDPAAIDRIEMDSYMFAASLGRQTVDTPFGTRFSIPTAVAARLLGLDHDITDDGSAIFASESVRALAQRIFVTEDPALTADYPRFQRSRMRLRLADGRSFAAGRPDQGQPEAAGPHSRTNSKASFSLWRAPAGATARKRRLETLCGPTAERVPDVGEFGSRIARHGEGFST